MRLPLHFPLLVFLLANAAPSEANLFARGTESLTRAANRLHHRAAKRSAGLAKDLRRAFSGMYTQELAATSGGSQQVYCVNSANAPSLGSGNSSSSSGSSSSNGTSSSSVQSWASASSSARASAGTSTKHSPSTTASNPSSTSSATSPWKLTKTYVRCPQCQTRSVYLLQCSKETRSLTGGTSLLVMTRRTA
ncbi:hypothetical protein C8T65DRAFT_61485 [Cerioporus squamosus]|nr:hypothetical protein C8T65DRAFT_61485 [Cerioporus squamosus]